MIDMMVEILLLVVLYCLGSAAYYMVSKKHDSVKMAKALTWRIVLSLAIFLLLMVGFYFGWVEPHPKVIMS